MMSELGASLKEASVESNITKSGAAEISPYNDSLRPNEGKLEMSELGRTRNVEVREVSYFTRAKISDELNAQSAELNTSYKERFDRTPLNGERGEWTGARGESEYIPNSEIASGKEAYEKLYEYGMDGVEYTNCIPDFSCCSVENVKIDMTENRYSNGKRGIVGNFEKADTQCSEKWNEIAKDGRSDWTPRDIERYRNDNNFTWHECSDRTTCRMVPREIHDYFGHTGGVSECRKESQNRGGIFDA